MARASSLGNERAQQFLPLTAILFRDVGRGFVEHLQEVFLEPSSHFLFEQASE